MSNTGLMLLVCAALALTVGAGTAAAGGGNAENAKKCQKGGWHSYATSDGRPFTSQDDCVGYAAQGGTCVALPDLRLDVDCYQAALDVVCTFGATNIGVGDVIGGPVVLRARLSYTLSDGVEGGYDLGGSGSAGPCPGSATSHPLDIGAPDVFTGFEATCASIAPGTTVLPLSAAGGPATSRPLDVLQGYSQGLVM